MKASKINLELVHDEQGNIIGLELWHRQNKRWCLISQKVVGGKLNCYTDGKLESTVCSDEYFGED